MPNDKLLLRSMPSTASAGVLVEATNRALNTLIGLQGSWDDGSSEGAFAERAIAADILAIRQALSASTATPASDGRLRMFLEILAASCGQADAGDYRWNWINAFCGEHEGRDPDTFNLAHQRGFTTVSHDTDTDQGMVYLTDAGRAFLATAPATNTDTPDRFGETIRAVTAEMRRFMPNACGDWADKIDAIVGSASEPEPLTAAEHGELCGYIHGKDYRDNTVEAVAYRQSRFEELKRRHDAHAAVKAAPDRFGEGYRAGVEASARVPQHVREIIGAATGSSIAMALAEASDRIRALQPATGDEA